MQIGNVIATQRVCLNIVKKNLSNRTSAFSQNNIVIFHDNIPTSSNNSQLLNRYRSRPTEPYFRDTFNRINSFDNVLIIEALTMRFEESSTFRQH